MEYDIKTSKLSLRSATIADSQDILKWRNDETTRTNSFNAYLISAKEHEAWFESALKDNAKHLWIAQDVTGNKIGIVSFFEKEKNTAEININLAPEKRNQGFGVFLIKQASQKFLNEIKIQKIIARIKITNIVSIGAFLKAGFLEVKQADGYLVMEYIN